MSNTKTFRLFISSTFSDFRAERELLQTKVFPHMRKYCAEKGGYSFQPIDLRWGVSAEAQLDQKTLELCLNEVRACKSHPHPNFLIMVGDRYGWVPLPYAIEKSEFETLLRQMNEDEKKKVLEWYQEDLNQLPVSYIIKERSGKYEDWEVWTEVEDSLRDILQRTVKFSGLTEELQRKYFLSATEAEVEEGIFDYLDQTPYQKKLVDEEKIDPCIDSDYVFGFLRTIKGSIGSTTYSDDSYDEAQGFKERLRAALPSSNTLETEMTLKSTSELEHNVQDNVALQEYLQELFGLFEQHAPLAAVDDEWDIADFTMDEKVEDFAQWAINKKSDLLYAIDSNDYVSLYMAVDKLIERSRYFQLDDIAHVLEKIKELEEENDTFEFRIVRFLEKSVDAFIEEKKNISPLQEELAAQAYYAQSKSYLFQGHEESLKVIADYIGGHGRQPLVIYGPSGQGKSALMAKALQRAEQNDNGKVLYRFVGATTNSSSGKDLLISLFDELDIDVRDPLYDLPVHVLDPRFADADAPYIETFEQFSQRIHEEFINLGSYAEKITIFIDGVDQLSNDDQFLWLPEKLPENVKIVISVLNDENYPGESKYLGTLQKKSTNLHKIPSFEDPVHLMHSILKGYNRTIQPHQEMYLRKQYESSQTPLFISVAAEEMRHWKSFDGTEDEISATNGGKVQDLADSQKGIVEEYVSNLYDFYHHDQRLVEKVLGYLYASRDGLSESELLQLLSADPAFVEMMVPQTWHENQSGELPTIVWSRLLLQLNPFLKQMQKYEVRLMYFFYREFEDYVARLPNLEEIYISVIEATQKMIVNSLEQEFQFVVTRWGELYLILLCGFEMRCTNTRKCVEYTEFLLNAPYETPFDSPVRWIEQACRVLSYMARKSLEANRKIEALTFTKIWQRIVSKFYRKGLSGIECDADVFASGEYIPLVCERLFGKDPYSVKQYVLTLNNFVEAYKVNGLAAQASVLEQSYRTMHNVLYDERSKLLEYDETVGKIIHSWYYLETFGSRIHKSKRKWLKDAWQFYALLKSDDIEPQERTTLLQAVDDVFERLGETIPKEMFGAYYFENVYVWWKANSASLLAFDENY